MSNELTAERKQWFEDHVGIFSGSQIHRLLADIDDKFLLKGNDLKVCIETIKNLPEGAFSESTGLPYVRFVNLTLPDDYERSFTQHEIRYAFKKMNPLTNGLKGYAQEKAIEMLSVCNPREIYLSRAVEDGKEREPEAIARLSKAIGMEANNTTGKDEIFLRYKDESLPFGATSDALFFGNSKIDFIGEAKCPSLKVHYEYLGINNGSDLKEVEKKYYYQMQAEIACAESDSGYFCTFNPEMRKKKHKFHHCLIERDDDVINKIVERVALARDYRDQYANKYN